MQIEVGKKYRVIDESRFLEGHNIKNGHEFTVESIDEDGDIWSHEIAWHEIDGDSEDVPLGGWALLMKGWQKHCEEAPADYSNAIEEV